MTGESVVLRMTPEQAEDLARAYLEGRLEALGVVGFRRVPRSVPATPHADVETPRSPERVAEYLSHLGPSSQPRDRAEAVASLIGVVRLQLSEAVREMSGSVGEDFGGADAATIEAQLEALLPDLGSARDLRQFYDMAAEAVRKWLLARLDAAAAAASDPEQARRVEVWREYHQAAGRVSRNLRAVHALLWYARLGYDEAAGILGLPTADLRTRAAALAEVLGPIQEHVGGKGAPA